ncbi:MAG TPA: ribose 5-phosphate isomerase B [Anaerolineae bacterium]|nr:ribose 5-phosphate isomerase B [Anaerolineae bacterium]
MTYSEDQIKNMVRKVLLRTLGPNGIEDNQPVEKGQVPFRLSRQTVTEADVLSVPAGGRLAIPAEAMITPLARDTALDRRVELVREPATAPKEHQITIASTVRTVALGADHGGYGMKEDLKAYLSELGYDVIDCGTHSSDSVDYPDFAYAVAKLVSERRAWRGIIIDGAGIGSCMAANKVPGVRAAMCYDHATAVNSREHNDANVLSLGGVLVGRSLARQIVKTWLETDFGGGRHARRVDKIMGIEQRFLRK